jgi:hypothetical protein
VFASDNPFGRVPPALLRLGRMLKLSLAACHLHELPDDLAGLGELRCDLFAVFLPADTA